MEWTDEMTKKFLHLYRHEPNIWNSKCLNSKDPKMVRLAWNRIKRAMGITVTELKKRLRELMDIYIEHSKKKYQALVLGSGVYVNNWEYYDIMEEFLIETYDFKSIHIMASVEQLKEQEQRNLRSAGDSDNSNDGQATKKRKTDHTESDHEINEEMKTAFKMLSRIIKEKIKERIKKEDKFDLYGKLLALKLRQLSEVDSMEVMYAIDGLFFKYRDSFSAGKVNSVDSSNENCGNTHGNESDSDESDYGAKIQPGGDASVKVEPADDMLEIHDMELPVPETVLPAKKSVLPNEKPLLSLKSEPAED